VNFSGADLQEADLVETRLRHAYLDGANFSRADLSGADLRAVNLREANLREADLSKAYLNDTWLIAADFSRANLSQANLTRARFRGTDLTEATTFGTTFADVDLSSVRGLESIRHTGPSTLGIDSIYKSRGSISEVFLRGCGVPDDIIAYIRSIAGAVQFYSCFISYSTKDQEFADRLYADLQAKGVRCWFAPHDIRGGRKIHEQIDEAIRLHDKLLLILSEDSMSSDWVQSEIAKARKREEKEAKRMLFPVRLVPFDALQEWECFDADRGKDSAREIREYFIPDFSNWKDHDSYQKAFTKLVADLKAQS
jgi:uncharacterized protein YjbI with pentapeptide repeats